MDCLVVNKVYDSCSKRECLEKMPFVLELPCGTTDDYVFSHTEFGKAVTEPYENMPVFTERDECYSNMKFVAAVPVWVVLRRKSDRCMIRVPARPVCAGTVQADNLVRFTIDVNVYAPRDFVRQGRFEPMCESYVETGCAILMESNSILLSLGFFFIIKAVSEVQLQIPNFGFCDVPPECEEKPCEVNFCETFLDENVTPFPQFFPNDVG